MTLHHLEERGLYTTYNISFLTKFQLVSTNSAAVIVWKQIKSGWNEGGHHFEAVVLKNRRTMFGPTIFLRWTQC